MSGLFTSLTNASSALNAAQYGLDITGQNIANMNTEGYARRAVTLVEVPAPDGKSGGTVDIGGVQALRDGLLEGRLRTELGAQGQQGSIANALGVVETALGSTGSSLDASLSAFFNSWGQLSADPTSVVARSSVLAQGSQLASTFNALSARFDGAGQNADAEVRSGVTQINALAGQIATLNASIGGATGAEAQALQDKENTALKTLAGLANITVMTRADGGADVTIGNGRALVVGANQYALGLSSTPPSGYAAITTTGGVDITSEMTSGSVGGVLRVRDTLLPDYKSQLDQIAFTVAQQVNTAHQAGYDLNGAAGQAFFTPIAAAAGAAAAISVNPTVAGDVDLVAASGTGTTGDNSNAKTLFDLQNARVVNGTATFVNAWSQLVYKVGSDTATAQTGETTAQDVVTAVQQLRDSISGVSLDQEATNMLMYQRAYQANAKYFNTVNSTLDTLMAMAGN